MKATIRDLTAEYRGCVDDAVRAGDLEFLLSLPFLSWMNGRDVMYRLEGIKLIIAQPR